VTVAADCIRHAPIISYELAKASHAPTVTNVSIQEIKTEIEALPLEERKRLAAFLVSLRHKELSEYRSRMAGKIDDKNPANWATLEELDQRLEA
jgi:hypothetical protein